VVLGAAVLIPKGLHAKEAHLETAAPSKRLPHYVGTNDSDNVFTEMATVARARCIAVQAARAALGLARPPLLVTMCPPTVHAVARMATPAKTARMATATLGTWMLPGPRVYMLMPTRYGYCGRSLAYCGSGCKSASGLCFNTAASSSAHDTTTLATVTRTVPVAPSRV
jgi:hypothetical protein